MALAAGDGVAVGGKGVGATAGEIGWPGRIRTGDGAAAGPDEDGASDGPEDLSGSPGLLRKEDGDGDSSAVMVGDGEIADGTDGVMSGSGEKAVVAVSAGVSNWAGVSNSVGDGEGDSRVCGLAAETEDWW